MKTYKSISVLSLFSLILLSGCNYSGDHRENSLYHQFSAPMDTLLHLIATTFNNNYGLAIITIVFIVRLVMLPFMLMQSKNGHQLRTKMNLIKPEITQLKTALIQAKTQEEKNKANKALMKLYKDNHINPIQSILGCLPLFVQMPILFGLYAALKWPSSGGLTAHADFLWFNLIHPDIIITLIAGCLYIIQPLITIKSLPKTQALLAMVWPLYLL
ncbi:membrane protein insertase YidC [Staphylococcus ratti]|uniref:Membrane protein insertase YidC n=1 Tax=Staphylococcus ratti TaxID=2892440 RepID=A0ABY3PCZ8_9STAP|nr:membrane protein insertase YidC [Staphylococcus ratti]UEX90158.1 membrane protein insertase YidC [Staphylococcus ratti]